MLYHHKKNFPKVKCFFINIKINVININKNDKISAPYNNKYKKMIYKYKFSLTNKKLVIKICKIAFS
jgi:hypothetical protein